MAGSLYLQDRKCEDFFLCKWATIQSLPKLYEQQALKAKTFQRDDLSSILDTNQGWERMEKY